MESHGTTPKLRQPVNRMVNDTVDQIINQIEGQGRPQQIEIEGPLVIRRSARIPKGWT